jgi:hypothetical protein
MRAKIPRISDSRQDLLVNPPLNIHPSNNGMVAIQPPEQECQCGGKVTQLTADQHIPVRFRALARHLLLVSASVNSSAVRVIPIHLRFARSHGNFTPVHRDLCRTCDAIRLPVVETPLQENPAYARTYKYSQLLSCMANSQL